VFSDEMSSDTGAVGIKFTDVDIKKIDYTDSANIIAVVDFTVKDSDGREQDRIRQFTLLKVNDVWKLHGDRHVVEISAHAQAIRSTSVQGPNACVSTGLEFYIEDIDPSNNGPTPIDYIKVFGPGLPEGGLRYDRPDLEGWWKIQGQSNSNYYVMGNSCSNAQAVTDTAIAGIPDNAAYLAVAYQEDGTRVNFPGGLSRPGQFADGAYVLNIDRRPLTLAEATASTLFPTITSPASPTAFASFNGGDLKVVASGLNPKAYADVFITIHSATEQVDVDAWTHSNADGVLDQSFTLTREKADALDWRSLRVVTQDAYRRGFMTIYN